MNGFSNEDLPSNLLENLDLQAFTQLTRLECKNRGFTDDTVEELPSQLEILILKYCSELVEPNMAKFTQLTELNISKCESMNMGWVVTTLPTQLKILKMNGDHDMLNVDMSHLTRLTILSIIDWTVDEHKLSRSLPDTSILCGESENGFYGHEYYYWLTYPYNSRRPTIEFLKQEGKPMEDIATVYLSD